MRVVGFVGVRKHSIGKGSLNRAANNLGRHNGGNFFSAVSARKFQCGATRRQPRAGNHCGERIQNVLLSLLHHFFRQCARARCAHVRAKLLHDGAYGVR